MVAGLMHRAQNAGGQRGDVGRERPAWQQVPALLLLVGGTPSGCPFGSALRWGSGLCKKQRFSGDGAGLYWPFLLSQCFHLK